MWVGEGILSDGGAHILEGENEFIVGYK